MSYKERRAKNVRQEGDLMTHFIDAHKSGDKKKLGEISRLMDRNVNQRKQLSREYGRGR